MPHHRQPRNSFDNVYGWRRGQAQRQDLYHGLLPVLQVHGDVRHPGQQIEPLPLAKVLELVTKAEMRSWDNGDYLEGRE